ncbi:MAG: TonB-dependent receptor, partial [Gemmatimonadaceae bacterium]
MSRFQPTMKIFQMTSLSVSTRTLLLAQIALGLAVPLLTLHAQAPSAQRLDTARVSVASRAGGMVDGSRSITVIERAEMDRRAARSVAEVVGWGLGMDLMPRSAAQADLAIRGSSFEQVLVLVDGVRVSDDQTGHFDLDL